MASTGKPLLKSIYQLGDDLGKGAFGRVCRCLNLKTAEILAVKETDKPRIGEEAMKGIRTELELLQKLQHPNIVRFLDWHETDDKLYFIMEYVEGGSLYEAIKKFGVFKENLAVILVNQILRGLSYLHKQGIVHRDVKGANVLLTKEGVCKLADFGSCTYAALRTQDGMIGTPFWMAPEIISGEAPSCSSDIWSLGCCIIEMLTGSPPYWSLGSELALFRMVEDAHPPLKFEMSNPLHEFLLHCFVKEVDSRATAEMLLGHSWLTSLWNNETLPSLDSERPHTRDRGRSFSTGIRASIAGLFGSQSSLSSSATSLGSSPPLSPTGRGRSQSVSVQPSTAALAAMLQDAPREVREAIIAETVGEWFGRSDPHLPTSPKKRSSKKMREAKHSMSASASVIEAQSQEKAAADSLLRNQLRSLSSDSLKENDRKDTKERRKQIALLNSASASAILVNSPPNSSSSPSKSKFSIRPPSGIVGSLPNLISPRKSSSSGLKNASTAVPVAIPVAVAPSGPNKVVSNLSLSLSLPVVDASPSPNLRPIVERRIHRVQQLLADAPVEWRGKAEIAEELGGLLLEICGLSDGLPDFPTQPLTSSGSGHTLITCSSADSVLLSTSLPAETPSHRKKSSKAGRHHNNHF